MKKIVYFRLKCIGCSVCALQAPNIWQMDKTDGKAQLLDAEFKKDNYFRMLWPDELETMKQIEQTCPTRAIQLL